ncbi:MAG: hypothetical protein ACK58T_20975, partial [Phycisphaerae bacterium]
GIGVDAQWCTDFACDVLRPLPTTERDAGSDARLGKEPADHAGSSAFTACDTIGTAESASRFV